MSLLLLQNFQIFTHWTFKHLFDKNRGVGGREWSHPSPPGPPDLLPSLFTFILTKYTQTHTSKWEGGREGELEEEHGEGGGGGGVGGHQQHLLLLLILLYLPGRLLM